MKADEWMRFCIENRTSKRQKEIMLVKRINKRYEQRLVNAFKKKESEWFNRHTLTFCMEDTDVEEKYVWVEYSKKQKRFTHITYEEDGCWHHIHLKNSPLLNSIQQ